MGTPCIVIAKEAYEITHWLACQDNGFTRSRRVVISTQMWQQMTTISNPTAGPTGTEYMPLADISVQSTSQFVDIDSVTNPNYRLQILLNKKLAKFEPTINADLMRRTDAVKEDGTPDNPLNMHPDLYIRAKLSPFEQLMKGLLEDEPEEYKEGNLSWYYEPALLPAGKGTGEDRILSVSGATYEEAYRNFLALAEEMGFNDGMSLVIPTRELVEEMLEGTDRDRDDMFGGLKMRGGVISVETIAINAVLAGCKPEHMPVLVAIAQGLAMGWEEDGTQWHVMTTASTGSALIAVVSGDIVNEIGMEIEPGFAGAGNGVNNTLARAFRMFYTNIALNHVQWIDTQGYGNRPNDYLMMVVPENVDATRELGWKTHAEYMGFPAGSSSVTITQASTTNYLTATNADTNWSGTNMSTVNRAAATGTAGSSGWYSDNFQLAFYSPAHAWAIKNGIGASAARATKDEWARPEGVNPVIATQKFYDPDNLGVGINADQNWPIVVGASNSATFSFNPGGATYKAGINNTVLISGSKESPGRGSPSAPTNVKVDIDQAARTAKLTWGVPTYLGGGEIRGYEVFMLNGADLIKMDPIRVPGGADARSYTFEGLAPGEQYHFRVRAMNDVVNAIYPINRGIQTDWGGLGAGTGQHWYDFDRITGIGAWGRVKNEARSAEVGHAVYSHVLPGRIRVPEITDALQNLIAHQQKESTDYLVRLPQNTPFSDHLDPDAKFLKVGAEDPSNYLRLRPGGDEQPFKLIFDDIENGTVSFPTQANGNVALDTLSGGTLLRGTISQTSLRTAHAGTTVNIIVTPAIGYELVSITINGIPAAVGGTATAATHSFVMPNADAKISTEFAPITPIVP